MAAPDPGALVPTGQQGGRRRLSAHCAQQPGNFFENIYREEPAVKQVAQNYKSGELAVLDVPAPACASGGVLVRSLYSLISTGTELMKVGESKLSLIGKARARPDQLKKVLDTVQQQGPLNAYRKAMNQLDSYTPLGYSLAGVVVEVGPGSGGVPRWPARSLRRQ